VGKNHGGADGLGTELVTPVVPTEQVEHFVKELRRRRGGNPCGVKLWSFNGLSTTSGKGNGIGSTAPKTQVFEKLDRSYAEFCKRRATIQSSASPLSSVLWEAHQQGFEHLANEGAELYRHLGGVLAGAVAAAAEGAAEGSDTIGEKPVKKTTPRDEEVWMMDRLSQQIAQAAAVPIATKLHAPASPSRSFRNATTAALRPTLWAIPTDSQSQPSTPIRPVPSSSYAKLAARTASAGQMSMQDLSRLSVSPSTPRQWADHDRSREIMTPDPNSITLGTPDTYDIGGISDLAEDSPRSGNPATSSVLG
jgi:hypothetical protein